MAGRFSRRTRSRKAPPAQSSARAERPTPRRTWRARSGRVNRFFWQLRSLRAGERRARLGHRGLDALGDALAGVADLLVEKGGLAVRHVAVGEPDAQDAGRDGPGLRERLPHGGTEPAHQDALLHRYERVVLGRELGHEADVDWLGEARVCDRHVHAPLPQQIRRLQALLDAGAVADDRHALPLELDLARPDLDRSRLLGPIDADGLA